MALEDILRALEEKAEVNIEAIKIEAQQRVKEIMAEVEGEAARTRRLRLKKVEDMIRSESTAVVYSASLKAKKELIKAQEETVDEAFRLAEERLSELHQEDSYPRILEVLLDECLEYLTGEVVFQVRRDDRALLEGIMANKQLPYRISDTSLEVSGGLIVSSAAGEISVLNTFESRLDKARNKLRLEISNSLFGA